MEGVGDWTESQSDRVTESQNDRGAYRINNIDSISGYADDALPPPLPESDYAIPPEPTSADNMEDIRAVYEPSWGGDWNGGLLATSEFPVNMPELDRYWAGPMHRPSTGPVLAHNGMCTGKLQ